MSTFIRHACWLVPGGIGGALLPDGLTVIAVCLIVASSHIYAAVIAKP